MLIGLFCTLRLTIIYIFGFQKNESYSMKKVKFIFLISICFFQISSLLGQRIVFDKEVELKRGLSDRRNIYGVWNEDENQTAIFMLDKKGGEFDLLDHQYKLINSFPIANFKSYHDKIEGFSYKDQTYYLHVTNVLRSEMLIKSFDTRNNTSSNKLLKLVKGYDNYIHSYSYKGKLYELSVMKGSSAIAIKIYHGDDKLERKIIPLDQYFESKSLPKLLRASMNTSAPVKIKRIDNSMPNSLENCASLRKIYFNKNKVVITINSKKNLDTYIIYLDLETYTGSVDKVSNPSINSTSRFRYNTFYLNGILYQLMVDQKRLCLSAYNSETKSNVKQYLVTRDAKIDFKNADIMQKGGGAFLPIDEKKLKSTSQLIRKMLSSHIGISVYAVENDKVVLTFGAYKKHGSPQMLLPGSPISSDFGVPIVTSGAYSLHYNPMYAIYSYEWSKAVEVKCLFHSKTLIHQKGSIRKNLLDRVQNLNEHLKSMVDKYGRVSPNIQTFFRANDVHMYGYYLAKMDKIVLRRYQ